MFAYTEWIRESFLFSEESVQNFQKYLRTRFLFYRDSFRKDSIQCHGRVPETVAQLEIGIEFFLRFLHERGGFADDWCRETFERVQSILTRLARKQSDSINEDKPTHVFIHKLFSLLESEKACLLKKNEIHDFVPQHCIGYEDEAWFYLHTDITHRMVRKLCDEQGESFAIKPKGLLKALAEEDLIKTSAGQNTVSIRINGKSKRLMCLDKHKAKLIAEEAL